MDMTIRQRLMSVLRGGVADRIPWSIYEWLLPDTPAARTMPAKGLALVGSRRIYRPVYDGVTVETQESHGGAGERLIHTRIETPVGALSEVATLDPSYGSRWIREFLIKGPEDYRAAEYYFRHTRFEPDDGPWYEADAAMGDAGIVIGEIMALPILHLYQYWMGLEGMAEGIHLYPDRFDALVDALEAHYHRQVELAAGSPAEVIWFPESISAHVISPRLFERYCLPTYRRAVPVLREAGKLIAAHYDGAIRPYLQQLASVDIPIIEAFTPPPMGDLSITEAKAAWPEKIIWINFPGNLFLEPTEAIEAYTLDLLRQGAPGGRLVMGCTEDFPMREFEKTFSAIGRALARYESREW